jgi:hypothetical protein
MLWAQWEEFHEDPKYVPVHEALAAGLANMEKWYCKADDTSIYFISHSTYSNNVCDHYSQLTDLVLDPRWKLTYVEAAWEPERVENNMRRLRKIVSLIHVSKFFI